MLKITCSDASPSCSRQSRPSSTVSTLAPKCSILPCFFSSRSVSKTAPSAITSRGMQCNWVRFSRSKPSRFSEASVCLMMFSLVKFPGHPGSEPRPSFVATNTLSECVRRNFPMNCSLLPSPYTSAVSKNVMPSCVAVVRISIAVASSTEPQEPPICQVPNPTSETSLLSGPNGRVFILCTP